MDYLYEEKALSAGYKLVCGDKVGLGLCRGDNYEEMSEVSHGGAHKAAFSLAYLVDNEIRFLAVLLQYYRISGKGSYAFVAENSSCTAIYYAFLKGCRIVVAAEDGIHTAHSLDYSTFAYVFFYHFLTVRSCGV